MHFGHPHSTLLPLCGFASSCLRLACDNGLPHSQDLSSQRAEKFGQIRYVWTRLYLCLLFMFIAAPSNALSFYSNPISFSIIILQKALWCRREPSRLDSCSQTSRPNVQNPVLLAVSITFLWINFLKFDVEGEFSVTPSRMTFLPLSLIIMISVYVWLK